MMANVQWKQDQTQTDGVLAQGFTVLRSGQAIPGVWWQPAERSGPTPLVLMGHGGSGHKRNDRMQMLGHMFSADYGWCATAIDGPVHGDRGPVTDPTQPEYRSMWQSAHPVQGMIDDWKATLDALSPLDAVDADRIGYWGHVDGDNVRAALCRL